MIPSIASVYAAVSARHLLFLCLVFCWACAVASFRIYRCHSPLFLKNTPWAAKRSRRKYCGPPRKYRKLRSWNASDTARVSVCVRWRFWILVSANSRRVFGAGVGVFNLEREDHSPWAAKIVSRHAGRDRKHYSNRLKLEAKVLSSLDHPNIVGYRAFVKRPDGREVRVRLLLANVCSCREPRSNFRYCWWNNANKVCTIWLKSESPRTLDRIP